MASCIETLAITGSRKSDGSVNAGGLVFLTQPGSANSAVTAYQDVGKSAAVSLVSGGYALDGAGKAVLFVENPCTVRITDTTGATVDTFAFGISTNAGIVEVTTPGWTGINSSGSAVSGAQTYLDKALASIYSSVGGLDGKFRGVYGIADTNLKAEIEQIGLTPQRFGAKGDGVTDDTSAWLNMAAAQSASGLPVFIPKGTYKISQVITFAFGSVITGVSKSISGGSNVLCTNGAQNGLVLGAQSVLQNISVTTLGSSGIGVTAGSNCQLVSVSISTGGGGLFATPFLASGGQCVATSCAFSGSTNAVTGGVTLINPTTISGATGTTVDRALTAWLNTQTGDLANGGLATVPPVAGTFAANGPSACRVRATSAGAGTINAANGTATCSLLSIECFNNSGGAFTFTFLAPLRSTGTVAPNNGNRVVVTFAWNNTDFLWVECGRTSTAAGI
jgi:Pectate lyase superfamily protein